MGLQIPLSHWDYTDEPRGRGQKYSATCKICGKTISRVLGGDLDDWAYSDFLEMLDDHDKNCKEV